MGGKTCFVDCPNHRRGFTSNVCIFSSELPIFTASRTKNAHSYTWLNWRGVSVHPHTRNHCKVNTTLHVSIRLYRLPYVYAHFYIFLFGSTRFYKFLYFSIHFYTFLYVSIGFHTFMHISIYISISFYSTRFYKFLYFSIHFYTFLYVHKFLYVVAFYMFLIYFCEQNF